jgi:proteasome assembly chaperone (PAC2) family protein
MPLEKLHFHFRPEMKSPSLIIGLSGWMNGGEVSLGTVQYLIDKFAAKEFAYLDPEGFFIYNFPGSMEVSALFRPHTKIEDGMIKEYKPPNNMFYCDSERDLIFLLGKEPHLAW